MLAGFTTEEAEADTVADQGLKRVNRIFGGLNEGIWPKTEELTTKSEYCSLDRFGGNSTSLMQKCDLEQNLRSLLEEMSNKKMNSRSLESVAQELVSAMMTSAYLLEKAVSSNDDVSISTGESCEQQR
ncbi:pleiotropic drug resistance protein 1-like [Dorcoceras hygrometricum]|uniref:Pleiotropic drug resistance protein 1-like n=1 Tax=Dorcoceras hygrometricum TaxID=472368 RepID=A0A2Z6ZRN2_9LAMI|nr:pleiotropic drug resistance protein 1-like [Dorcoceras hygrometricum]